MQNRQLIFSPKIQYEMVAERSKADFKSLSFSKMWDYTIKFGLILSKIPNGCQPVRSARAGSIKLVSGQGVSSP